MTSNKRRIVAGALAGGLAAFAAAAFAAAPAHAASSSPVPFTDEYQHGLITLCNAKGQRVTSGSMLATPFIAKAVSSTPAPTGYTHGLATLYAYQPIQYVDPGDWSGDQLTGSTYFSNAAHPGAASTPSDEPLITFSGVYPLHWDGLLELRFLYTAPNQEAYPGDYPAAVLKVTGKTWTAVEEGNTPCNATKTRSLETIDLKKSQYDPKGTTNVATLGAGASTTSGSTKQSGKHSKSSGSGASARSSSSPAADSTTANGGGSSGGSHTGLWVLVVAGAVVVLGGGGVAIRRLRA